jgi:hypothetical protein
VALIATVGRQIEDSAHPQSMTPARWPRKGNETTHEESRETSSDPALKVDREPVPFEGYQDGVYLHGTWAGLMLGACPR